MFEPAYMGFDSLYVAFKGALPIETIARLKEVRDQAAERQEDVLTEIGPGKVPGHLASHGLKGGYAFIFDTGPVGEQWLFKANSDPRQWNIFARPHAATLAALGYQGTKDQLFARLDQMGCRSTEHSINRVDFAMDFLSDFFELHPEQFVAPPRTKITPHFGEQQDLSSDHPSSVFSGRRVESVTVGRMPGRQIIVYDKRAQIASRPKLFYWFEIWKIACHDRSKGVWRVEIRAGKNELKETWNLRTFADLETSIGDVFQHALNQVRYVADGQTDSNVTRQELHPLWISAREALSHSLFDYRSGLTPGQVKETEREAALEYYRRNILGNAAGFAVAQGLSNEEIEERFSAILSGLAEDALRDPEGRVFKSAQRAREKLHFIAGEK